MAEDFKREVDRMNKEILRCRDRLHTIGGDIMVKYLEIINELNSLHRKLGWLEAKAGFPFVEDDR